MATLLNGKTLGLSESEKKKYSLADAVRAASKGPFAAEGLIRECHNALYDALPIEQRANSQGLLIPSGDIDWGFPTKTRQFSQFSQRSVMNSIQPEYGGNLVPTELLADKFIESLRNRSRVLSLGATVLPGLSANIEIPKTDTNTNVFWVKENQVIPDTGMSFSNITLKPKTVGAIANFSRILGMQSTPNIEMLVKQNLIATLSIGLDRAMLFGSGLAADAEPRGIVNTPGIQSVIAGNPDGGELSYELLAEMEAKIYSENAEGSGGLSWLVNSQVRKKARTTTENSSNVSNWIWTDTGNGDGAMLGHRAMISENVPKNLTKGSGTNLSTIFFGNWSSCVFGAFGTMELLSNPFGKGWENGSTEVRVLMSCDYAVMHPESFVVCTDVVTA